MSVALLLATTATAVVGGAVLHTVRGLRQEVAALRAERAADQARAAELRDRDALTALPHQTRTSESPLTPAAEIRAAVTEALAEERERELAEARAFWAAQEARDAADAPSLLGGLTGTEDLSYYLPGTNDFLAADFATAFEDGEFHKLLERAQERVDAEDAAEDDEEELPEDSAELAAARRRHPSHPDFVPRPANGSGDHDPTMRRLEELAAERVILSDIRPGPLGTLDVYVFTDGTTLGMTPGHRETAELLGQALRDGRPPVLMGGSSLSGAYALTFSCGDESVYILADRVIASSPE
ncbi:hypothetical protein ACQPZG_21290 [Streptomyces sp. CA-294286]|uniref:hypothetical protein n=1 Tax=Streptomyces sp. CA-294286 TaxID=3240070 RepID=UPI003D8D0D0E